MVKCCHCDKNIISFVDNFKKMKNENRFFNFGRTAFEKFCMDLDDLGLIF